jgi:uncharacterized protein (TIGR00369 family)
VPATDYPPPDHILRDLGIHVEAPSASTARARIPATAQVLGADGGVRAGVLAVLVDLAAGAAAVRSLHPDSMATADLTVQLAAPAAGPWVEAQAAVIRRGRTTLVVEAAIFDVDGPDVPGSGADPVPAPDLIAVEPASDTAGEQVGMGTVTMAVLPARPDATTVAPESFPLRWAFGGGGLSRPVAEAVSVRVVDRAAGRLVMPVVPYVHNSFGAAQGGVMALLAELSGLAAVGSAAAGGDEAGRVAAATDLQVAYVALGRVGPIRSRAEVLGISADGRGQAVVELTDQGAGDRLTTVVNLGVTVPDMSIAVA